MVWSVRDQKTNLLYVHLMALEFIRAHICKILEFIATVGMLEKCINYIIERFVGKKQNSICGSWEHKLYGICTLATDTPQVN